MSKIWLELSHHTAFRIGGWAFVRADGAAVSGQAGGERRVDGERAALLALLAALAGLQTKGPVTLSTASPLVAMIPGRIVAARAGQNPPAENLDLWALAATALAGVQLVRIAAAPKTPAAFCAVWAEFARDKAKDKGAFTSPIPRANLAKAGVA